MKMSNKSQFEAGRFGSDHEVSFRIPLTSIMHLQNAITDCVFHQVTGWKRHFNSTSASCILPLIQCPGSSVYPPIGTVPCLICVSSHWYSAMPHLCILPLVQCPGSSVSSHWYSALANLCILPLIQVQCPGSSVYPPIGRIHR